MSRTSLFLLSYDISDHRLRRKMSELLLDYGDRVQYSVFEVYVTAQQLDEILDKAGMLLDTKTDSLRVYPLCRSCQKKRHVEGKEPMVEARDETMVIL